MRRSEAEGRSPKAIARFARAEGVGLPEREYPPSPKDELPKAVATGVREPEGPPGAERRASARARQKGIVCPDLQGDCPPPLPKDAEALVPCLKPIEKRFNAK